MASFPSIIPRAEQQAVGARRFGDHAARALANLAPPPLPDEGPYPGSLPDPGGFDPGYTAPPPDYGGFLPEPPSGGFQPEMPPASGFDPMATLPEANNGVNLAEMANTSPPEPMGDPWANLGPSVQAGAETPESQAAAFGAHAADVIAKLTTSQGPAGAVPEEASPFDRWSPDQPPNPPFTRLNLPGLPGMALPVAPVPPKPVAPSEEEQKRVLEGRPFTPEAAVSELGKFFGQQGGQTQPASAMDVVFTEKAAERAVRRAEAMGGRGGAVGGDLVRAAGPASSYEPSPQDFSAFMQSRLGKKKRNLEGAEIAEGPQAKIDTSAKAEEAYYLRKQQEEDETGLRPATDLEAMRSMAPRRPIWMEPVTRSEEPLPAVPRGTGEFGQEPGFPLRPEVGQGAPPPPRPPGRPTASAVPPPEPPLAGVERALARPSESVVQRVRNGAHRLLRESYDRVYPLRELDDLAGNDPNTGAHAAAQVVSGAIAAGEEKLRTTALPLIEGIGRDFPTLERYWMLKSAEDLSARDPAARLPGGIVGPAGVQRGLAALEKQAGPEVMGRVKAALDQLWRLNDEVRLKPLLAEGLISPEEYRNYKINNPHYLPFHRYEYGGADATHLVPSRATASTSGPNIGQRSLVGSTLALDNPVERWMADIIDTQRLVFQNRAARALVDTLKTVGDKTGQRLVAVADEGPAGTAGLTRPTVDRGAVTFFDPAKPGVKQVANVPAIYATVAKNLEAEPANLFFRVMSALALPFRMGHTALSLAFMPRNVIRDVQSAYLREGLTPLSGHYWQGMKAALFRNADFSEAALAGALQSGLLESRKTEDVLKRAQQLRGIQVRTPQDALLLLPRLVGKSASPILRANEILEQGPRIAAFLKARAEGAPTLAAAVRGRDVTVDFSKSGNFVRNMNMMIPFLNARIQGTANTVRAFRDDPLKATLTYGAPAAFASVAAFLWNQRFETADQIPDYEWDRNWVWIVGEGQEAPDPKEPNRTPEKYPIYVKIPKGDAGAVITSPVELGLRLAWQQGDRTVAEHALQAARAMAGGVSPVDLNASGGLGLAAPPVASTGYGLATNYDVFRQRPIVPESEKNRPPEEQFTADTSRPSVALGRAAGVSPDLVDWAVKSYTGGGGQQVMWLLDLGLGALGYNPTPVGQEMRQPRTPDQALARAPGVSGLVGVSNTQTARVGVDRLERAVEDSQRRFYQQPDVRRLGVSIGQVGETADGIKLTPQERVAYQTAVADVALPIVEEVTAQGYFRDAEPGIQRRILQDILRDAAEEARYGVLSKVPGEELNRRARESAPVAVP